MSAPATPREEALTVLQTATVWRMRMDAPEWSAADEDEFKAPIRAQYEDQGSPYYSTARLWDDGVITPGQTRRVLSLALDVISRSPLPDSRFGLFRM